MIYTDAYILYRVLYIGYIGIWHLYIGIWHLYIGIPMYNLASLYRHLASLYRHAYIGFPYIGIWHLYIVYRHPYIGFPNPTPLYRHPRLQALQASLYRFPGARKMTVSWVCLKDLSLTYREMGSLCPLIINRSGPSAFVPVGTLTQKNVSKKTPDFLPHGREEASLKVLNTELEKDGNNRSLPSFSNSVFKAFKLEPSMACFTSTAR